MDIEHQILQIKPREESGSKTSRKYTFQNDWSLFLLLRHHEKSNDYVYLFDFHEDLVVLDSITPKKIDFYQIKSKDNGNWTIRALTKKESGKLSILGKLYLNKLNFPSHTNSLNFVSNAKFSIKDLKSKEDSTLMTYIKASEFDDANITLCREALNTEHNPNKCDDFVDFMNLKVAKLSNSDSSTHCQGELGNLIHRINPENKVNVKLAYTQISGEILKKSNATFSDRTFSSLVELIDLKGISKNQFVEYLEKAGLYKSVEEEWSEVQHILSNSGFTPIELLKYRKGWRDVSMKLISDVVKIPLMTLKKDIENIIEDGEINGTISDKSSIHQIFNMVIPQLNNILFDDYFVKCLILKVLYEKF